VPMYDDPAGVAELVAAHVRAQRGRERRTA
jgi:hypothetical protein